MNMKRIVFAAGAILICLVIIGIMLHSMARVDEINQKRREKNKGEALASRIITTTATTSIWDALRPTETETGNSAETVPEAVQETAGFGEEDAEIITEDALSQETAPVPQTYTETVIIP
ncbi:MAG: hypothetical protein IJ644_09295 [Oscillospiraceae bacterium]|nr:hypothetical protein [Oscillospiraceae bacterium]